ncbi:sugar transferase [Candidatus Latescibacterota bacterium]
MLKRLLDIVGALVGLALASPVLLPTMIVIWLQDMHSPLYIAPRIGLKGRLFSMVKLRSMVVRADQSGVDSTAATDPRITRVGRFVRRYKLDELTQLWNVLVGDMSLVGPRPNVKRETDLYTDVERGLLSVRPGITDCASIVFADENEILAGKDDPDLAYNQLIRPWKSQLGLLYIEHRSMVLDVRLMALTVLAVVSRERALDRLQGLLKDIDAPESIMQAAARTTELTPHPPPGSDDVVRHR